MGLDGIEILMAVEEEFQIEIGYADASKCKTVGQLVEVVCSHVCHDPKEPCPSQQGFYQVRRALVEALHVKRSTVRPDTRLDQLFAVKSRRREWKRFMSVLVGPGEPMVGLVRPRWLSILIPIVSLSVGLAIFKWQFLFLALLCAFVLAIALSYLTIPFMRCFPTKYSYVKDLLRFVKTTSPRTWNSEQVFQTIRAIIVEQMRVAPSAVTMEADFVHDLGVS